MVKFKALYKGMNDDLKDAEMMIDYACEISKHEEDKALADEIAKYAQYRLEHFMNFHKLFENEASKEKNVDKETVSGCMCEPAKELRLRGDISDIFGNTETIVIFLCNRIFFLSA